MCGYRCGHQWSVEVGKLTAIKVKSIKEPGRYGDGDGLMFVHKPSGAQSWIVRVQAAGRRRDVGLGPYPAISLAEAREKAAETRKQFRGGIDPVEAKRVSRRIQAALPTFREEATAFHEERKGQWDNPKHRDQWLSSLKAYAYPSIGDMRVDRITGADVRQLLVPIWQAKAETARRVLQRVTAVLDFAHSRGHRPDEAPLRSIRAGLGKQTTRVKHFAAMPFADVPDFMTKLGESDSSGRLALQFAILTAARSGEVRGATWGEIDRKAKQWRIPASRMKARRAHTVPLSPAALAILDRAESLRTLKGDQPIFPGLRNKPLSDMTLSKALRSNSDAKWTVHGFRSSFRDWAGLRCTDMPSAAVEAALAHVISDKTEAAYHRTDYLEIRASLMDRWAAHLTGSAAKGPV